MDEHWKTSLFEKHLPREIRTLLENNESLKCSRFGDQQVYMTNDRDIP